MKTFKLNGFDVVVCCDPMLVDLWYEDYYINQPLLSNDWDEWFGLCHIGQEEPILECEHCQKEIVIK